MVEESYERSAKQTCHSGEFPPSGPKCTMEQHALVCTHTHSEYSSVLFFFVFLLFILIFVFSPRTKRWESTQTVWCIIIIIKNESVAEGAATALQLLDRETCLPVYCDDVQEESV